LSRPVDQLISDNLADPASFLVLHSQRFLHVYSDFMGSLPECCMFLYDAYAKYSTNQKSRHKFRLKFYDACLRHETLVRTVCLGGCVISQINRC